MRSYHLINIYNLEPSGMVALLLGGKMAEKIYKCAFKHCKHEKQDVLESESEKVGNRYMHKDCAKTSINITKVKDLYYEKISKTVVMKQLVSVINAIVFNKNIEAEYLFFALSYAISNKIPIRSPYGLHYLIDNNKIKSTWKKKQSQIIRESINEDENMISYSNHLGMYSEDLDFETKRQLGNFPQAYSHLAFINTAALFSEEKKLSKFIRP